MPASVRLYKESQRIALAKEVSWREYFHEVLLKDTVMWLSLGLGLASCLLARPSLNYIDFKTLGCLFCLMTASAGFMAAGIFDRAAALMVNSSRNSRQLGFILVFGTFFAAMLITNDVSLLILVPLALIAYRKIGANPCLTVILQTVAANVGSALLPIGNPQNLYLFSFFHMGTSEFLRAVWPIVTAGAALLAIICLFNGKRNSAHPSVPAVRMRLDRAAPFAAVFLAAILAVFNILDYRLAFALAAALAVYRGKNILQQIDYALLLTFIGFFIFVGNLSTHSLVAETLGELMRRSAYLTAVAMSQVISNVPAAVLLSRFTDDASALLAGVSAGGCGTLIASMASLISYKLYVRRCGGKWRYLWLFTVFNLLFLLVLSLAWGITKGG